MSRRPRIPLPAATALEPAADPFTALQRRRPLAVYAPSLDRELAEAQDAIVRLGELDPAVTEAVRLRCARYHDCELCRSLRLGDAGGRLLDERRADAIDDYERSDLDRRIKVALRYADAVIGSPGRIDAQLIEDLRRDFDERQIVELTLDICKWSTQKIHVAMGTDAPPGELPRDESGAIDFRFDASGRIAGFGGTSKEE